MSDLNVDWAIKELGKFAALAAPDPFGGEPDARVTGQAAIAEQILNRVFTDWETDVPDPQVFDRWGHMRDAAIQALELLHRQAEIAENLGDSSPVLSVSDLHPWIWSGAASLWKSGHFRSAVEDAAKKVNAETQNKVGRRDISETDLFSQIFTEKAAEPGKPRLRRIPDDGSKTYKSVQRGAMALAEGIFAGIRNPLSHEVGEDLDEQVALEYLAALSVLARWVDESTVERAGDAS